MNKNKPTLVLIYDNFVLRMFSLGLEIPGTLLKWKIFFQAFYSYLHLLLFSHPIMCDSLWPHGLKHARHPCPSVSPRVCPSSCSLHQWCHSAISSSDILFSFCLCSFPTSGLFQWAIFLYQMTKILEVHLQCPSFQWIFRVDLP